MLIASARILVPRSMTIDKEDDKDGDDDDDHVRRGNRRADVERPDLPRLTRSLRLSLAVLAISSFL